ncbi:MAG: DUF6288 domain-containing protein [Akkermansiaceae bacterium]
MLLRTDHARQILIIQVDEGSPADGVLKIGEIILGIGKSINGHVNTHGKPSYFRHFLRNIRTVCEKTSRFSFLRYPWPSLRAFKYQTG